MAVRDHCCREEEHLSILEFRHGRRSPPVMDQGQVGRSREAACLHQIEIVGLEARLCHLG